MQINNVVMSGRLTRDPEVRYTAKGKALCNFQIAQNKRWKDAAGEEKEKVGFFPCAAFGKIAELMQNHLHKGDEAVYEGELEYHAWEKDGVRREIVRLSVQKIHFVGRRKAQGEEAADTGAVTKSSKQEDDFADEDIPF
jgi:single-strand DNA-binding protein